MNLPANTPWPQAIQVTPLEQNRLQVWMKDGRVLILDLSALIYRREIYWRLRQDRYFRQVRIDPIGGICWPEGEDLAPEGLERYQVH